MKFLLIALLGITTAFAQSEPVTRIKGESETSYKISPNLIVPNKQATKLTSTSARIETGNNNLLKNPSFEAGQVDEGWICNGQEVIASSIGVVDGDKSLKFGGSSSGYSCVQDLTVGNKYYGQVIEVGGFVSGERDGRFCYRESGAGVKCFNYTAGSGMKQFRFKTTVDSISTIGISVLKTQAGVGSFYIDGMYLGLPRNNLEKSDLNNLLDGGFENGYGNAEWLVTGSATFDYVVPTSLRTKNNKYALELNFTGPGSVYTIWNRGTDKVSMPAACNGWVQPFSTNVSVEVRASSGDLLGTKKFTSNDLGKWVKFSIPFKTDTTNHYECIIKSEDSNKSYIDDMFFGPFDAEAIVAKFDNTTGWVDFGPTVWAATTTAPTKGTISRDKVWGKRNGTNLDLRVEYRQTSAGSQGSGVFFLEMPSSFQGQTITFDSSLSLISPPTATTTTGLIGDSLIGSGNYNYADGSNGALFAYPTSNGRRIAIKALPMNKNANSFNVIWLNSVEMLFNYATATITLNLSIPIAEWSSQTNAAIVACKEGELKCANEYTARVNSSGAVVGASVNNWITGCTWNTSNWLCNLNSNLGLTKPMICKSGAAYASSTANVVFNIVGETTSSFMAGTYDGNNSPREFKVTCTKQFPDYNEAYERVFNLENFYVDANEIIVGYDRIDNKPIYQRCHKVVSDITATNTNIVAWGSGLNPIQSLNFYATNFTILNSSEPTASAHVYYSRTNGQVGVTLTGGTKLGAGTKVCMEYTR